MEKSLAIKIVGIISLILLGISAVLGVLFYVLLTPTEVPMVSPMLVFTYILFGLVVAITIIFSLIGMFSTKKATIDSLKIIGITGALVLISYLMSSSEMPTFFGADTFELTASKLQLIDTALFTMYILTAFAFVGLIYSEVRAAFK